MPENVHYFLDKISKNLSIVQSKSAKARSVETAFSQDTTVAFQLCVGPHRDTNIPTLYYIEN